MKKIIFTPISFFTSRLHIYLTKKYIEKYLEIKKEIISIEKEVINLKKILDQSCIKVTGFTPRHPYSDISLDVTITNEDTVMSIIRLLIIKRIKDLKKLKSKLNKLTN